MKIQNLKLTVNAVIKLKNKFIIFKIWLKTVLHFDNLLN